ncbi:unnamed protein product [Victoria cruziana]
MASNSTSPTISTTSSSGNSEEDLQQKMDERRQKRMLSNRESARRSRMRKQKHLDELMAQVTLLRNENNQILSRMHVTTQHYLTLEAENATLRAQIMELSARLQGLTEMLGYMQDLSGLCMDPVEQYPDPLLRPWDVPLMNQPITASADIFQY